MKSGCYIKSFGFLREKRKDSSLPDGNEHMSHLGVTCHAKAGSSLLASVTGGPFRDLNSWKRGKGEWCAE